MISLQANILRNCIRPGLRWMADVCAKDALARPEAQWNLLLFGQQESKFEHVRQGNNGPARSWWQEEPFTSHDFMTRATVTKPALVQLGAQGLTRAEIGDLTERSPLVALTIARDILWERGGTLPSLADGLAKGEACYLKCWKPGKHCSDRFARSWEIAKAAWLEVSE